MKGLLLACLLFAHAASFADNVLFLADGQIIDEPGLTIPHPRLLVRPFVRIPLAEVALPGLRHPRTHAALATAEPDATVRRLGPMPRKMILSGMVPFPRMKPPITISSPVLTGVRVLMFVSFDTAERSRS